MAKESSVYGAGVGRGGGRKAEGGRSAARPRPPYAPTWSAAAQPGLARAGTRDKRQHGHRRWVWQSGGRRDRSRSRAHLLAEQRVTGFPPSPSVTTVGVLAAHQPTRAPRPTLERAYAHVTLHHAGGHAFQCVRASSLSAQGTTLPHDICARYRARRTHGTLPGTMFPPGFLQLRTPHAGFALCRADDRGGDSDPTPAPDRGAQRRRLKH
jgi:hypothetical protein